MRARTAGADQEPDKRRRAPTRRRAVAIGAIALGCGAVALSVALSTGGGASGAKGVTAGRGHERAAKDSSRASACGGGLRVLQVVDHSRQIELADGRREPRTLETYVRYPALGPASGTDLL